ncbi:hypothetical protein BC834DRAFT_1040890 [Gloeopeniophorella convolvens]|nr:hypothetical protein BC834DRAFT_1040890 [Gloeopeniophorella convolvens]
MENQGEPLPGDAPRGDTFSDPSGALFSMYLSRAEKVDKDQAESWKADADGILVYTGLFSATVAAFIIESYRNLQPDSGNASVALLAQISQQLAIPPGTSLPSSAIPGLAELSNFRRPPSAVWINSLWFLSLVMSLTCALLATLLQQWARRYLLVSQERGSKLHDRARIRSFFAEGLIKYRFHEVAQALPALLHFSVFLFFAGLLIFLFNIDLIVFCVVTPPVAACILIYAALTFMPLLHHSSPYQTPLSVFVWFLTMGTLRMIKRVCGYSFLIQNQTRSVVWSRVANPLPHNAGYSEWNLEWSIARHFKASAKNRHWTIDARAFAWTLDLLDEDHELEQFAAGIPGLFRSQVVTRPKEMLAQITQHSILHPNLGTDIKKLVSRSSAAAAYALSPASRIQRDQACLRALHFIPGTIRGALESAFRGPNSTFTIPPFLYGIESWRVAEELRQDTSVELKIRVAAECVAAMNAACLDPADPRVALAVAERLHMTRDELARCVREHEHDKLLLAHLVMFVLRMSRAALSMQHIIDPTLTQRTLGVILARKSPGGWPAAHEVAPGLRAAFDQTWDELGRAEANLSIEPAGVDTLFPSFDYVKALRNIAIMREALQPAYDTFQRTSTGNSGSPIPSAQPSPVSTVVTPTHETLLPVPSELRWESPQEGDAGLGTVSRLSQPFAEPSSFPNSSSMGVHEESPSLDRYSSAV